MSKKLIVVAMLIILCLNVTSRPTCYEPNEIPFVYDSNQVDFKLLGAIEVLQGQSIREKLNYYDPDGDKCIAYYISNPIGMTLSGQDPNIFIVWTPAQTQVGLFYVDVEIMDRPPPWRLPGPLAGQGTFIVKVNKLNQPPAFRPLCGG